MPRERSVDYLAVGRELVAARKQGTPWKVLVAQLRLSRTTLYLCWRAAREDGECAGLNY